MRVITISEEFIAEAVGATEFAMRQILGALRQKGGECKVRLVDKPGPLGIVSADTLSEEIDWIPVTERLPKEETKVLVWPGDDGSSVAYYDAGRGWIETLTHDYGDSKIEDVTHWAEIKGPKC